MRNGGRRATKVLQQATDLVALLIGAGVVLAAVTVLLEDGPLSSGLALMVAGLALLPFIPIPGRGSRLTLFVLGVGTAIMLPVMDSFDVHRQSRSAVRFALGVADALAKGSAPEGVWPADARVGLPEQLPVPGDGFEYDVMVADCGGRSCVLVLTFKDERFKSQLKGRSFGLWTTDGSRTWSCGPAGLRPVAASDLPSTCREQYPF